MKILLIDDHALIREALHGVLKKLKRGAVVLEASDSREALDAIENHPDISLVLLDLNLPDRNGLIVLGEIRARYPAIAIVVLSAIQDRDNVMRALDLGVVGYIPKSARREIMLGALQLIFAGGVYIPPEILTHNEISHSVPIPQSNDQPIVSPSDVGLSARQIEVLALLMQGKNNKVICRALNLAENTVKNHITVILRALKVTSRTEAVVAATELGWKFPKPPNA